MKKLIALLMALLLCGAAFAQEAEAPAFALDNGVHWGMTLEEVLAVYGREEYKFVDETSYTLTTSELKNVPYGTYEEADVVFLFVGGQLAAMEIEPDLWVEYDAEEIEELRQALITRYGEADETLPVPAAVQSRVEKNEAQVICGWQAAADTYVCLVRYEDYIEVGYYNVQFDLVAESLTKAP